MAEDDARKSARGAKSSVEGAKSSEEGAKSSEEGAKRETWRAPAAAEHARRQQSTATVVSVSWRRSAINLGMGRRETRRNEARSGAPGARYPIYWGKRLRTGMSISRSRRRCKLKTAVCGR